MIGNKNKIFLTYISKYHNYIIIIKYIRHFSCIFRLESFFEKNMATSVIWHSLLNTDIFEHFYVKICSLIKRRVAA